MPSPNMENEPVSVQLEDGESVTVPSGEVWKVTISLGWAMDSDDADSSASVLVNGNPVIYMATEDNNDASSTGSNHTTDAVLTGGDEIELDVINSSTGDKGCQVGGWVVN